MKKYFFFLPICLLLFASHDAFSQSIVIKSAKNGSLYLTADATVEGNGVAGALFQNMKIQSSKKVTFNDGAIQFENVVINCDELVISGSVRSIAIIGNVKISCRKISFENAVAAGANGINITKAGAVLATALFSISTKEEIANFRDIVIANSDKLSVNFDSK